MASRQKDIKKIYKKLKKRYPDDPIVLSRDRKILEHLVFAIFLENVSFARAREAFAAMENYFIDWNEIRVSKANEIAAVVPDIPDAINAGERLRRLLQWVFDETYKFDLEDMRAKGRDEVYEFLKTVPFSTPFMNDYVSLFGFGNGNFPLDEGELRALRLLDFVQVSDDRREIVPDLDGALSETERLEFFFALHELGSELADESRRADAMKFLRSIDAKVDERAWKPLVEAAGPTDPREIARMVAKQEKRQKRSAPSMLDAMDMLDDSLDSDDLESSDDLLEKTEEAEDFSDGFGEDLSGDLRDADDDAREKTLKKRRARKDVVERRADEETSLTKNGATYSHFSSDDAESLFESSEKDGDDKKSGAKPRKKSRVDESDKLNDAENDEKIVRKDSGAAPKKNVDREKDAFARETIDDAAQEPLKTTKKTRTKPETSAPIDKKTAKNGAFEPSAAVKNDKDVKKEERDGVKKTPPPPARKSAPKKDKETKKETFDALDEASNAAKSKAKSKAKAEKSRDDELDASKTAKNVSKTKEIQQKKPR